MQRRKPLKPWHGLLFFLVVMAVFFLICAPMQYRWGMYGLAATELLILGLALLFAVLFHYPLSVLFPIRRPSFLPLLGVVILWGSSYLITMVVSLIQYRLFPLQMDQVSGGINDMIWSIPFLLSVLITAILPAICEEAVHRGVILHTLYSIKKEWMIILIMGVYFGLFHTHPLRFLPTALLGAMISYIMLETENMVYPAAFHFINNFLPLLLQLTLSNNYADNPALETGSTISYIPLVTIGVYLVFAASAPFLIYLGSYFLHWKPGEKRPFFPQKDRRKQVLGILLPTVLIGSAGVLTFLYGIFFDPIFHRMLQETLHHSLG